MGGDGRGGSSCILWCGAKAPDAPKASRFPRAGVRTDTWPWLAGRTEIANQEREWGRTVLKSTALPFTRWAVACLTGLARIEVASERFPSPLCDRISSAREEQRISSSAAAAALRNFAASTRNVNRARFSEDKSFGSLENKMCEFWQI